MIKTNQELEKDIRNFKKIVKNLEQEILRLNSKIVRLEAKLGMEDVPKKMEKKKTLQEISTYMMKLPSLDLDHWEERNLDFLW